MRICHGVIEFLVMPTMMHAWGLLGFDWESGTTLGSMSELATTRLVYLLASAQPGALDSIVYVYGLRGLPLHSTPESRVRKGKSTFIAYYHTGATYICMRTDDNVPPPKLKYVGYWPFAYCTGRYNPGYVVSRVVGSL